MIGREMMNPKRQYIKIIRAYWIFKMKSFSLSLLKTTTGMTNGSMMILIGKKVIVTPP